MTYHETRNSEQLSYLDEGHRYNFDAQSIGRRTALAAQQA
jgi:hypothetical protein